MQTGSCNNEGLNIYLNVYVLTFKVKVNYSTGKVRVDWFLYVFFFF